MNINSCCRILFVMLFFIVSCKRDTGSARKKVESLLNKISEGNAVDEFPEKYFPRDQTVRLMDQLKDNCDFKNRRGNFINDFYQKNVGGTDEISFIYEYYLKCDSIRFIITYKIEDSLTLLGFKLESIKKDNPMIIESGRRLKF